MTQPYIMTWINAEPNSIRLTGPFNTDDEAAAWGRDWEHRDPDVSDLLWQLVYIDQQVIETRDTADHFFPVPIEAAAPVHRSQKAA